MICYAVYLDKKVTKYVIELGKIESGKMYLETKYEESR